jgi:hypothetical protein
MKTSATRLSYDRNGMRLVLSLLVLCAACRRSGASAPAPSESAADPLPARIGDFAAGPLVRDEAAARRTYARGRTRIEVTLARFPMSAEQYGDWVRTSTEGYPQAALGLPPADANGFYQCAPEGTRSCDLLIQLRAGFHVEIRGGGTSSRADVDAIARGLPLGALAASAP